MDVFIYNIYMKCKIYIITLVWEICQSTVLKISDDVENYNPLKKVLSNLLINIFQDVIQIISVHYF